MNSLRARLLASATIILIVFLGLTGFILDKAYEKSARVNQISRLEADVHDLIRIADPSASSALTIPGNQTDHRLMQPSSGLYAQITSQDKRVIWRSLSLIGNEVPFKEHVTAGKQLFYEINNSKTKEPLFAMSMGVIWVDNRGIERAYTFSVAESKALFNAQVKEFRSALWLWLGGLVIVLLLTEWGILNWGLLPLKKVARDLREIEEGKLEELTGDYPRELSRLTGNINVLLAHERARQERYRHAMSDLAHSLKTPLAVLRSVTESENNLSNLKQVVSEQVSRLDQIARYQLQRAATSGKSTFTKPLTIPDKVETICQALSKVYADKQVICQREIDPASVFYGEEGDILEVLGNLLDNAYKWCDKQVSIQTKMHVDERGRHIGLAVTVSDDGPGIPEHEISRVTQRGARADTKKEGHGIGMAMICDIVSAYGGELYINNQETGGAKIDAFFPK